MKMARYPIDSDARRIGSRAAAILHYQINWRQWQYREITGQDVGCDCELELSVNNQWRGFKIEAQIKGTTRFDSFLLSDKTQISFPLEIKTINYALGCNNPFLLVVVDVNKEECHFVPLQELFLSNQEVLQKLVQRNEREDEGTMNIRFKTSMTISKCEPDLQMIATCQYAGGPTMNLRRVNA